MSFFVTRFIFLTFLEYKKTHIFLMFKHNHQGFRQFKPMVQRNLMAIFFYEVPNFKFVQSESYVLVRFTISVVCFSTISSRTGDIRFMDRVSGGPLVLTHNV